MEYRRFGKTEKMLSAITMGGMRFKHCWEDPYDEIPSDTQEHCNQLVQLALDYGINHFETARGYKKSETVFGRTLNEHLKVKRDRYFLMTKGAPVTAEDMRIKVEEQLTTLKTDYLDFYAWHGINNFDILKESCKTGGAIEELHKLKEEGIVKHIGFSTHAPLEVIIKTIETDLFEFVNLHYYYFNQRNEAAISMAELKDMGVFIISPNDKGGQLFNAPQKVRNAIPHATPIQWNARFCLQNPSVHTLSFGMTEPEHYAEMNKIFPTHIPLSGNDLQSKFKLDKMIGDDPYAAYGGFNLGNDRSNIDIPEILRWRKLWKCYDMLDFARYRYKELNNENHWVRGVLATPSNINKINWDKVPQDIPLKEMLTEAHEAFYKNPSVVKSINPKDLTFVKNKNTN
ncbi:aldo/keto reductase [Saccharicrinis aurantiacus]|uniref:aldo/keto reductase n=1 Tax=Saccharicrinis aurantiacus TaxID=1849719 RepID=UPI00083944D9|nr:aldo/keto reductase [Saccharicrinis aurantiacus]